MKGYRASFSEHEYYVMIEREQKKRSFKAISEDLGLSRERARQIYRNAKRVQKRLYYKVIQEENGLSTTDMRDLMRGIEAEYNQDINYINAYLEYFYYDILDAYRNGEPQSIYKIAEYTPKKRGWNLGKTISTENWRYELTQEETDILQDAQSGQSIQDMAASRKISDKDAYYLLRTAKLVRYRKTVHQVAELAGFPYAFVYRHADLLHKRFDDRFAFLLDILQRVEAGEAVDRYFRD